MTQALLLLQHIYKSASCYCTDLNAQYVFGKNSSPLWMLA